MGDAWRGTGDGVRGLIAAWEARTLDAEQIVRLTASQDPHSLMMLARVYQAAGHPQSALNALRLALPLARQQAADLVPTIEGEITALEVPRK